MRLKRLDLKAFGPFTDRVIAFDSHEPGLHIIFGRNEAGKSSSLRALKALLYGFDRQTPDNFLHNYHQLLVGGCLVNSAGEEIVFHRRKKNVGDIVDADGNPLDPDVLKPFIRGIDPDIFESLYGIDHDALVRGGNDILDQKGEVGQALFAAGAGISSVQEVIEALDQEAGDLFKPTGQKPQINRAIKRYKALKKEVKAASLSITDWQKHRKSLKVAMLERDGLEKERDQKIARLHRLERLEQAVPELAALASRKAQLRALGDVVSLNPGFIQTHQQVSRQIHEATVQLDRDTVRLEKLQEKHKGIPLNKDLLLHSEQVDDFHQRLGEYRKGQKDRPERNGMRISHRSEAARLLKQVRPDLSLEQVESLRPVLSKKRTVQSLIPQYDTIHHQMTQARKQGNLAKRERAVLAEKFVDMHEIRSSRGLVRAVKPAQQAGDIDAQVEKRRRDVDLTQNDCMARIKRMGLWSGDLTSLMALALPLSETVHQYDVRFSAHADDRRRLEKERKQSIREREAARVEMAKEAHSGEVPTEAALTRSRETRARGWQLLRRQWLDQEDVTQESRRYDPNRPLVEAYEWRVEAADHIADRLRREADRVAHAAALGARIEALEEALGENDRDMAFLKRRMQDDQSGWHRQWQPAGITPLSPKEMSSWLAEMDKLRFRVEEMFNKERDLDLDLKRRKALRQALGDELLSMGEKGMPEGDALGPLLIFAETVLEKNDRRKADLEELKKQQEQSDQAIHQAEQDLESARLSMAKWQEQWQRALAGLGLKNEVATVEAIDHIETLQSCFDRLHTADDLQKRIDGMDRDAAQLSAEVAALVAKVAPNLAVLPLDRIILQLRALLVQVQKDSTLYDDISKEMDTLSEEISAVQKTLAGADAQMDQLLRTARCENPDALAAAMGRFIEYQRLTEKVSDIEAVLAKIGAGMSIETLSKEANQVNADELPGMIAALKRDIGERINPEINRISQIIGEEYNQLAAMDGSAKAADIAEEMEHELAGIRRFADRYALLKLASRILQQEIERYREEHQDPVLKIASGYFNDLTLGAFVGLRTDVDDKAGPILVGLRPDGSRLTVDKMSTGTRDQMFLALRLASVAWRLETGEPMPLVVDDILINFDDDRSRATLAVLADLSKKNQVILFTHHHQIVETAKHIDGVGTIHIHAL